MADYDIAGVVRNRSGGTLPGVAPANAYPTSDGSEVLIAGNADAVFARLCLAMGDPDLAEDERFADAHGPRHERAGTRCARGDLDRDARTPTSCWRSLREHAVPAGRVYTAADMLTDPHYLARNMIERHVSRTGIDTPMLGVVPKFSRTPGSIGDVGPSLGEHTSTVFG